MALKSVVTDINEVPEVLREHYTEQDGKFVLQAEGYVSKSKVDEFRNNNIELQKRLDALKDVNPEEYRALKAEQEKLKEKKLIDAGDIDKVVEERVTKMRGEYDQKVTGLSEENQKLSRSLEKHIVDNALSTAANAAGVRNTAVDDVLLRGRGVFKVVNGVAVPMDGDKVIYGKDGVTPMSMGEWLAELATKAPHLFNPSTGGGAPGNTGSGGVGSTVRSKADLATPQDKAKYIGEHGRDAYLSLPAK